MSAVTQEQVGHRSKMSIGLRWQRIDTTVITLRGQFNDRAPQKRSLILLWTYQTQLNILQSIQNLKSRAVVCQLPVKVYKVSKLYKSSVIFQPKFFYKIEHCLQILKNLDLRKGKRIHYFTKFYPHIYHTSRMNKNKENRAKMLLNECYLTIGAFFTADRQKLLIL